MTSFRWKSLALLAAVHVSCSSASDLSQSQDRSDLSQYHTPGATRFCEVGFGDHFSNLAVEHRPFQVEMEEGTEDRSRATLCGGRVEAELAFDLDRRLYRIALRSPGQCLHGICVGDSFASASRQPGIVPFITEEEGGILFLRSSDPGLTFDIETGDMPIDCFRSPDACPQIIGEKRVSAAVLSQVALPHSRIP